MSNRILTALGDSFSFTMQNTSGATVIVAILAAFYQTLAAISPAAPGDPIVFRQSNPAEIVAAGYPCGVVADDGTPVANVTFTASNPNFTIKQFREYLKVGPGVICKEMTVQANNVDVFEKVITLVKASPLTGSAREFLRLSPFKSVDQQDNSKIVIRNLSLEMAYDTLMLFSLDNNRTVTFTFTF